MRNAKGDPCSKSKPPQVVKQNPSHSHVRHDYPDEEKLNLIYSPFARKWFSVYFVSENRGYKSETEKSPNGIDRRKNFFWSDNQ